MKWRWRRRQQHSYAVGIPGLAATARGMLPGRLYAVATPAMQTGSGADSVTTDAADGAASAERLYLNHVARPIEPADNALSKISAGCIAGTVAGALRDHGTAVAVLHSPVDGFLARLAQHAVNVSGALASGQLIILKQTGGYDDKLAHHGAQHFVDELDYLGVSRHSLVVIERAERLFSAKDEYSAVAQLRTYQRWFAEAHVTGLLSFQSHAVSSAASRALRALDDCFAGLAFIRTEGPRFIWQVDHWLSPLGSISQREYGISFDQDGALPVADGSELEGATARIQQAPDQDRVIATRAVIDGERGAPAHWRIVSDLQELLEVAKGAVADTCIVDFHGGDHLRVLARAVHYLRRTCGHGLRIVIRERNLRLRYNDELLLLRLGANTVVYAEVGFSRFISLVESLHGQAYIGAIPDDFESAVQAALPPPHSGYLTPDAFCDMVRESIAQSAHIGVESTLICLYLLPETAHLDALLACHIKRPGDLFTVGERSIWIFLYACREPDADATLDRVCREPLAQMFEGHVRFFSPVDILGAIDGLESRLYSTPVADYTAQLAVAADSSSPSALPAVTLKVELPMPDVLPERPQASTTARRRTVTRQPLPLMKTDGPA